MLVSIMKAEDDSVEVPVPLQKIANFVTYSSHPFFYPLQFFN